MKFTEEWRLLEFALTHGLHINDFRKQLKNNSYDLKITFAVYLQYI